jgi:acyl-homoserine-lactone acylase
MRRLVRLRSALLGAGLLLLLALPVAGQSLAGTPAVQPDQVTIARDSLGIPHIYAPTDAGAVYGLGWAQAEDRFPQMQQNLILTRGRLGELKGREGAIMDYFLHYTGARAIVDSTYQKHVSPHFQQMATAFCRAVNRYARQHPDEILLEGLFPVTPKDVMTGYVLSFFGMVGLPQALKKIMAGEPNEYVFPPRFGSNAMAFRADKTQNGHTTLVINPHVAMSGKRAFYQVHLQSESGWNFHGVLFPGMMTPALGASPHHAWAMTYNWPDYVDIYKLRINPDNKNEYRYNGEWVPFQRRKVKLKARVLDLFNWPVRREVLRTHYGPAIRTDDGVYATAFPQYKSARIAEQWYRLSKAEDLAAFEEALKMRSLSMFNFLYADDEDNIMFLFNALLPKTQPGYDYQQVLPGDTSATQWQGYLAYDRLPRYLNPSCGYLYNCNNTPFQATCPAENLERTERYPLDRLAWNIENNRDARLQELLYNSGKLSQAEIRTIKYDATYPKKGSMRRVTLRAIDSLTPADHREGLAEAIEHLQAWNFSGAPENRHAALALLTFLHLGEEHNISFGGLQRGFAFSQAELIEGLEYARTQLLRNFGRIDVPLRRVQRLRRGGKDLGLGGLPETLRAIYTQPADSGRRRAHKGDTFIAFVAFEPGEGLVNYETVLPYGNASNPNSPHFNDQMEAFVNQRTYEVTLNKHRILQQAVRQYHPGTTYRAQE